MVLKLSPREFEAEKYQISSTGFRVDTAAKAPPRSSARRQSLRTTEADKVRCGRRRFEALGVPFAVVTSAGDV